MARQKSYWLVKSEPDCFSIQHLAACDKQTTCWSGVRNYQARNFMRAMSVGDRVLFYHSSADPPAVAGTAVVVRAAYPDPTAWDPRDDHFDPKASPDNPIWQMVDIQFEQAFSQSVPIGLLRTLPALKEMELLRQGSRLSVQSVRPREFETIVRLASRSGKTKPPQSTKRATKEPKTAKPRKRQRAP